MPSEPDNLIELQPDFQLGQPPSISDLIAQEGGSFLKGESPVPKLVQAVTTINLFIDQHLSDSSGALQAVLRTWVSTDEIRVSQYLDRPLTALQKSLESILTNPELLYELVKQADIKWGQLYDERPHFQRPGQVPDPEDEYTHESVRSQLTDLLNRVNAAL